STFCDPPHLLSEYIGRCRGEGAAERQKLLFDVRGIRDQSVERHDGGEGWEDRQESIERHTAGHDGNVVAFALAEGASDAVFPAAAELARVLRFPPRTIVPLLF